MGWSGAYILIGLAALVWIAIKIFGNYNSNNILSNEASFQMFVQSEYLNVDEYFDLPKGTFDKEKHILVCKLPVEVEGFKESHVIVRTDLNDINCNAQPEKGTYTQYESYELKGTDFELLLVNKNTNLMALNSPLGESLILAKKSLSYNYAKGKVNRLVVSESGISDYCK